MTPLFAKLNLGAHRDVVVVNAPESFEPELSALPDVTIHRDPRRLTEIAFAIVFVKAFSEIEATTSWLPRATGDAVFWFAYPKQTSKRYCCEFNRDTGWAAVQAAGFESVRQVAIDDDWSALRFRRTEYIKSGRRAARTAPRRKGAERRKRKRS